MIGAREFLLAFNINLDTDSEETAKAIAGAIRESGPTKKMAAKHPELIASHIPFCKAIGWHIEEFGCAQVSTNLTNFKVTSLHEVFEACKTKAETLGVSVTGSELIGMLPAQALKSAGAFYLGEKAVEASPSELYQAATEGLGLSSLSPFDPNQRVIEEKLKLL